ncbi:Flavin-dependent oxidoreductase, luciferase family (includes alkanesulfonate monooxygenase SsuD and methylene tetrahydromethanopterin reductase) [Mycobacterium rhizamassiliense]|jgi:probable F420-dependent oxidoreductase|uniref:Flavin-dependent oxidoreductase, luciferase family (Includes alkanesulfonate monooxygenase SsuD and methylene tetrahydromethanopterin reductase) n=1 Tax=Mycobacterium rhizamassiliense TaxID=1841860 RepID=A0A2U3P0I5_9MYCO|nr:LLM class F420-dependent oxidoreductase [Mycobacterium rhizamassiliense]SPM37261.1 Flavin-dependent oxidoreductase, luciferase family (includes alkanesulfonate monooxygenase SsuD and methylene tetrahydromethanopterin reductase) [Mycobacterium rhizamassiliense]
MRFGVAGFVTDEGIGPGELGAQLEQRGFASLFLAEHSHIPVNTKTPFLGGGPIPRQYHRSLDPFVALTAAAGVTTTLALGTSVALIPNRDPIMTAKEVASLDLVSQGRFRFGVGVGWLREEIADHGIDPAVRGRVADERLAAMITIWTQEKAEFHGEFVDFDPIFCWPKPVQQPHPPLYVGGGPANFERITRLKAGWIPMSTSADVMSEQLTELHTVAGHDVPVIGVHMGDHTPADIAKYRQLDMEELLIELPTEPRDQTLRHLDALQPLIAELA